VNTIFDYIDWRGDLSFSASPMNDVDNYIIAKLGTPDLTGVVPSGFSDPVSLSEALLFYDTLYGPTGDKLGALTSDRILPAMRLLPNTVRYRELALCGFRKTIDPERTEQFSAVTVKLPDGRYYVSFRGTDDTLLGWKENLLMSVESRVAAQGDAAAYLLEAAENLRGRLVVGGHSKGGNLAVYAASAAPAEVQERIDVIYSNDGPGFLPEYLSSEGYRRIRNKIRLLIPEHSVVGTLLYQDAEPIYVKAKRFGIASHDGFAWQVLGPDFVHVTDLSESSRNFHRYISDLMKAMSPEELRSFINDYFGLLEATGATTITELTELRLKDSLTLAKALRKSKESRRFLSVLFEVLWKDND